jgi:tetraacyldisaccharide 4'-kinase
LGAFAGAFLLNQRDWYNLISGSKAGIAAAVVRAILGIVGFIYLVIVGVRNFLYSRDILKSYGVTKAGLKTTDRAQATVPVISIGNITAGGTGKTPLVIWLCNYLRAKGINCAILTRGYKAAQGANTDEPAVLAKNCPGTSVIVNPDRLAGAIEAVRRHKAQVLVMDDGFQHRRLHRNIDIVTIDATQPFGFGKMLPAGLLREPVTSLKRAHAAIITRSDQVAKQDLDSLAGMLKSINQNIVIAYAVHNPVCAVSAGDKKIPLERLKGKPVFAFCGIANPDAFFTTIGELGANIVGVKIYNDHYNYKSIDLKVIKEEAEKTAGPTPPYIITTEKDFNKIGQQMAGDAEIVLAYLAVKLQFVEGQEQITGLIERALAGKITGK